MADKRDGVGHSIWPHYNMCSRLKSINRKAPYHILIFSHCLKTQKGTRWTCSGEKLFRTGSRIPGKICLFLGVFRQSIFFIFQKEGLICLEPQYNGFSLLLEAYLTVLCHKMSNNYALAIDFCPGENVSLGTLHMSIQQIVQ